MTQRRWWVSAGIAVAVMAAAFPIEAVVAGLLAAGRSAAPSSGPGNP